MSIKEEQINRAYELGRKAFYESKNPIPKEDLKLQSIFKNRTSRRTPHGEAKKHEVYNAWLSAWHSENFNKS